MSVRKMEWKEGLKPFQCKADSQLEIDSYFRIQPFLSFLASFYPSLL